MHPTLQRPEFWAAHYYLLIADDEHDSQELVEPIFGFTDTQITDYYLNELVQPDEIASPLWLPLGRDFSVGVVYADCGDDGNEVRYLLDHPSWSEPELIGFDSPHFALPALRWEEIVLLHSAMRADNALEASAVALLMFPATYLTSAAQQAEAQNWLTAWWKNFPVIQPKAIETLVRNIVAYRTVPEVRWWHDAALGWITNDVNSLRNPDTRMRPLSQQRFERVRDVFNWAARQAS